MASKHKKAEHSCKWCSYKAARKDNVSRHEKTCVLRVAALEEEEPEQTERAEVTSARPSSDPSTEGIINFNGGNQPAGTAVNDLFCVQGVAQWIINAWYEGKATNEDTLDAAFEVRRQFLIPAAQFEQQQQQLQSFASSEVSGSPDSGYGPSLDFSEYVNWDLCS